MSFLSHSIDPSGNAPSPPKIVLGRNITMPGSIVDLPVIRCSNRSCPGRHVNDVPLICENSACTREFHLDCFKARFQWENWPKQKDGQVVCRKACYTKLLNPPRLNWTNDGKNGKEDPQSSERILFDWLMFPGNYVNNWRGKDNKGQNKMQVARDIAQVINDSGVIVRRDEKQVRNKIQHLERRFRVAFDFANTETGAGLQENDRGAFDDAVLQKCPQYFDLLDVFSDRASSKPKATNMDHSLASSDTSNYSSLSDDEKNPSTKRRSIYSSSLNKKTRTGIVATASEQSSAATVRLANVKSQLLSFQLAKLEEDREKERQTWAIEQQNKEVDVRMHLVKQCIAFVSDNPGWPKEDVLQVFPAFAGIIEMVFSNMHH